MNNYSYVTLLNTFEYAPAIAVLAQSMQDCGTRYPLTVICTCGHEEDLSSWFSSFSNVKLIFKPHIEHNKIIDSCYSHSIYLNEREGFYYLYDEFWMFSLIEYDKICFLDADSLMIQNADSVFNFPSGSMQSWWGENYDEQYAQIMMSLFILCPKCYSFDFYCKLAKFVPTSIEGILEQIFTQPIIDVNYRIPVNYFYGCYYGDIIPKENFDYDVRSKDIKILHFQSGARKKIWSLFKNELEICKDNYPAQIYLQYLQRVFQCCPEDSKQLLQHYEYYDPYEIQNVYSEIENPCQATPQFYTLLLDDDEDMNWVNNTERFLQYWYLTLYQNLQIKREFPEAEFHIWFGPLEILPEDIIKNLEKYNIKICRKSDTDQSEEEIRLIYIDKRVIFIKPILKQLCSFKEFYQYNYNKEAKLLIHIMNTGSDSILTNMENGKHLPNSQVAYINRNEDYTFSKIPKEALILYKPDFRISNTEIIDKAFPDIISKLKTISAESLHP